MNKTISTKRIGLWLDHSKAHFIDPNSGKATLETIFAATDPLYKGETAIGTLLGNNRATNNENHKHNRDQKLLNEYYQVLTDRLKNYDDIFLFGPTTAKDELYNKIKEDKHFGNKTINIASSDQLTENQMIAKTKDFFNE